MFWNVTTSSRGSLLLAALAFLFLCFNVDTSKTQRSSGHFGNEAKSSWLSPDCHHPNEDTEDFHRSVCEGYEIAVHSVWTEMQCLDNCLRLPYCDKYIFDREEIPSCTLLYTGDIASAPEGANLKVMTDGKCRSKAFQDFLLGTEGCSHLYRTDDSNMPRESETTSNGRA